MRNIGAAILATSMLVSTVAIAAPTAPLTAGKPAGVKQAQMEGTGLMWGLGIALVAAGAILVSNDNGSSSVTTTTSTTP